MCGQSQQIITNTWVVLFLRRILNIGMGRFTGSTKQLGLHVWSVGPSIAFVRAGSEHLRSLLEVHLEGVGLETSNCA